jgi:hypothetical protein
MRSMKKLQFIEIKLENFNTLHNIPKVYVCREPEKMLCKEIHVTDKDIKQYEESILEEGELFG